MSKTIDFLSTRRSVTAKMMKPGHVKKEDLDLILHTGLRVPDHGGLKPWKVIVFRGNSRKKFDEERLQQKKREMKVEEKMIQVREKFEQQRIVENAKEKLQMEALSDYEKRRAIRRQTKGYHTSVSLQEKGGKEDAEELAARIFEGTDAHSTSCSGSSDLEEV